MADIKPPQRRDIIRGLATVPFIKPPFLGAGLVPMSRGVGYLPPAPPVGPFNLRGWDVSTNDANSENGGQYAYVNSVGYFPFTIPASYVTGTPFSIEVDGGLFPTVAGQFPSAVDCVVSFGIATANDQPPHSQALSASGYSWAPGTHQKLWEASASWTAELDNPPALLHYNGGNTYDDTTLDLGPTFPGEGGYLVSGIDRTPFGWDPDFPLSNQHPQNTYFLNPGQDVECTFFFQTVPNDFINPTYACFPYAKTIRVFMGTDVLTIPLSSVTVGFGPQGSAGLPWAQPGPRNNYFGFPWNKFAPVAKVKPTKSGGVGRPDSGSQDVWLEPLPVVPPVYPAWVLALRAPSGDLPLSVFDWKNGRYWADGVVQDVLFFTRPGFGNASNWQPAVSVIPGSGLRAFNTKNLWGLAYFLVEQILTGCTTLQRVALAPGSGDSFEIDIFNSGALDNYGLMQETAGHVQGQLVGVGTTNGPLIANTGNNGFAANILAGPGVMAASADGGANFIQLAGVPVAPATAVGNYSSNGPSFCTLQVIYKPQPDGDLAAISLLDVP